MLKLQSLEILSGLQTITNELNFDRKETRAHQMGDQEKMKKYDNH